MQTTCRVQKVAMCRVQRAARGTLQMVALIGAEVNMALPTTALFDYPSPEALAYFIASAQVPESQPAQHPAYLYIQAADCPLGSITASPVCRAHSVSSSADVRPASRVMQVLRALY